MNDMYLTGAVVLAISTLLNMGAAIATIRASTRAKDRDPPLPEEIAKVYATKSELISFRCEWKSACVDQHRHIDTTLGKLFDLDRDAQHRLVEWQRGVSIQLGKIENAVMGKN